MKLDYEVLNYLSREMDSRLVDRTVDSDFSEVYSSRVYRFQHQSLLSS